MSVRIRRWRGRCLRIRIGVEEFDVDPTPFCVERDDAYGDELIASDDITGTIGCRVAHCTARQVALGPCRFHVATVGGVAIDAGYHRVADRMLRHEREEARRVVEFVAAVAASAAGSLRTTASALAGLLRRRGRTVALLGRRLVVRRVGGLGDDLVDRRRVGLAARLLLGGRRLGGNRRRSGRQLRRRLRCALRRRLGCALRSTARATVSRSTPAAPAALGIALGLAHRTAAGRATHRHPVDEHPADMIDRLATDEATLVEEPLVFAVELLERVVGEDRSTDLVGHLEDEGVASSDDAGGRDDDLSRLDGLLELRLLVVVDAVGERRVDDHRDRLVRALAHDGANGFVELGEAGEIAALGGDVGAIDNEMRGRGGAHDRYQ